MCDIRGSHHNRTMGALTDERVTELMTGARRAIGLSMTELDFSLAVDTAGTRRMTEGLEVPAPRPCIKRV